MSSHPWSWTTRPSVRDQLVDIRVREAGLDTWPCQRESGASPRPETGAWAWRSPSHDGSTRTSHRVCQTSAAVHVRIRGELRTPAIAAHEIVDRLKRHVRDLHISRAGPDRCHAPPDHDCRQSTQTQVGSDQFWGGMPAPSRLKPSCLSYKTPNPSGSNGSIRHTECLSWIHFARPPLTPMRILSTIFVSPVLLVRVARYYPKEPLCQPSAD